MMGNLSMAGTMFRDGSFQLQIFYRTKPALRLSYAVPANITRDPRQRIRLCVATTAVGTSTGRLMAFLSRYITERYATMELYAAIGLLIGMDRFSQSKPSTTSLIMAANSAQSLHRTLTMNTRRTTIGGLSPSSSYGVPPSPLHIPLRAGKVKSGQGTNGHMHILIRKLPHEIQNAIDRTAGRDMT